eukprot:TRINITY_DN56028_c0_g1_i1.p1 TRINITY_DN56028_c0_g1~~TRINITY_DN56028_c0_g1_i1.p1  ORF type:complete len:246 (-),score=25.08 TRINITY_DN56028_c0_g1_i1:487-1224(-)
MANQLLFHAVVSADPEQVQALLTEAHADVNARNSLGETPLHVAIYQRITSAVELLLSYGANPNVHTKEHVGSDTPLTIAARTDFMRGADLLLAANADPDARDAIGLTALHHAARNGSLSMARLLLNAGANPDLRDSMGRWPVSWARDLHHMDVASLLSQYAITSTSGTTVIAATGTAVDVTGGTSGGATGGTGGARKGAPHGWLQRVGALQEQVVWQERPGAAASRSRAAGAAATASGKSKGKKT